MKRIKLFGELGYCEYSISIIRSIKEWTVGCYEIVLLNEQDRETYMHVDEETLHKIMQSAKVYKPSELIGGEVITERSFSSAKNKAILPKGVHVELIAYDNDGHQQEIQFEEY